MPEPTPTKFTNLDATTTWCRTCDLAVSMPHEHPITVPFAAATPTKPTPTVIDSDREIARAAHICNGCTRLTHAEAIDGGATAIAAAREAWGVPREAHNAQLDHIAERLEAMGADLATLRTRWDAVAGLVEAAQTLSDELPSITTKHHEDPPYPPFDYTSPSGVMVKGATVLAVRAALERVKG